MHYGFVIDTKRCFGCNTCAIACRNDHNLPKGVWWNRILTDGGEAVDTPKGEGESRSYTHYAVACQHCENPACVKVCPVGATYKEEETGIVCQDPERCIGCRMCMSACPYNGVRSFNWEEPKYDMDWPVGDPDAAPHVKHTVEKCTMCHEKVSKGQDPYCVQACIGRARFWGDLDDSSSEVSKLLASRKHEQLLTDKGTRPSVYYLV